MQINQNSKKNCPFQNYPEAKNLRNVVYLQFVKGLINEKSGLNLKQFSPQGGK